MGDVLDLSPARLLELRNLGKRSIKEFLAFAIRTSADMMGRFPLPLLSSFAPSTDLPPVQALPDPCLSSPRTFANSFAGHIARAKSRPSANCSPPSRTPRYRRISPFSGRILSQLKLEGPLRKPIQTYLRTGSWKSCSAFSTSGIASSCPDGSLPPTSARGTNSPKNSG